MHFKGKVILKLVDMFTGYAVFQHLPDATSLSLVRALKRNWFRYFGPPTSTFSDKGSENTSKETLEFLE